MVTQAVLATERPGEILMPPGVALAGFAILPLMRLDGGLDIAIALLMGLAGLLMMIAGSHRRSLVVLEGGELVLRFYSWPNRCRQQVVGHPGQGVQIESEDVGRDDVDYRYTVIVGGATVWSFRFHPQAESLKSSLLSLGWVATQE